jgi:hypothetical protein
MIELQAVTWNATTGIQFSFQNGERGGFITLKDAATIADLAEADKANKNVRIVSNKIANCRSRQEREELIERRRGYEARAATVGERVKARAIAAIEAGQGRPSSGESMDNPVV